MRQVRRDPSGNASVVAHESDVCPQTLAAGQLIHAREQEWRHLSSDDVLLCHFPQSLIDRLLDAPRPLFFRYRYSEYRATAAKVCASKGAAASASLFTRALTGSPEEGVKNA